MNWDDFRIFLALARIGKLSETGKALHIDHSTVARRVRSLEKSLSNALFERQPNGYKLTSAGEDLVSFAETLESTILSAEGKVSSKSEQLSGHVRVASPEGIAAFAVTKAAHRICEMHPNLKIQLLTNAQKYSLSKRETDIMIAVSKPKSGRLKVQKITDVNLHLYATRSYLEKFRPIRNLSDLRLVRGISYVSELIPDKELDYEFLFESNLVNQLTATSVHVQAAAILESAGVGIMHDFMAGAHSDLVRILPREISIKRSLWAIVHEDYAGLNRIREAKGIIVDEIRNQLKHST